MLYAGAAEHVAANPPVEKSTPASPPYVADPGVASATLEQNRSLWARGRLAAFERLAANNDLAIAAILKIPQLEATVPVFAGTSEPAMTLGAGHLQDTTTLKGDGNIALSSHRDGAFRILKDVQRGDSITLTTDVGVRTFVVNRLFIVQPTETRVLAPTLKTTLTLITCHPFYYVGKAPNRYIVQAELVDEHANASGSGGL